MYRHDLLSPRRCGHAQDRCGRRLRLFSYIRKARAIFYKTYIYNLHVLTICVHEMCIYIYIYIYISIIYVHNKSSHRNYPPHGVKCIMYIMVIMSNFFEIQICISWSKPSYILYAFSWFICLQITHRSQVDPQFVVVHNSSSTRINLSKTRLGPTRKCVINGKWLLL